MPGLVPGIHVFVFYLIEDVDGRDKPAMTAAPAWRKIVLGAGRIAMIDRRTFTTLFAGALASPNTAWGQTMPHKAVFYASVGPALTLYHLDVDKAALARQGTVQLPANVQYAWPHPSAHFLYVASSSGGPGSRGVQGTEHYLTALRVDPATGALQAHGPSAALPSRPIHMSLDRTGAYALTAYNNPSGVTVHRINADGTVGEEVKQTAPLDGGIYGHQVRATPANNAVILVTRGNAAAAGKPEDPGALKVYGFKDGQLTNRASIAPNGGYGFGPRHLDFHPSLPLAYLSLETQNKLYVYRLKGDTLEPDAIFRKETLAEPGNIRGRQAASTVHVHPSGRFVYVGNRASNTVEFEGKKVFPGGENSIAVYVIDQTTGEPTLIQNADVHGIHPRTFSLDPSGRMLVSAQILPMLVRDGTGVKPVPANLTTFRLGADGKLTFANAYEVDTGGGMQFWSGMVALS
jgi:6-phosphogluconolactonase (cycloisomerase 2 family)